MSSREFSESTASKLVLRRRFGERRKSIDPVAAAEASVETARLAVGLPAFTRARVVALFSPIRGELNPLEMVDLAESSGKRFVLPRSHISSRGLTFHLPDIDPTHIGHRGCAEKIMAAMSPGAYGILEPQGARVELAEIDLIVVPALAYDLRGHRLGYGAGYYDRLLKALEQTLERGCRWGVGYGWQVVEGLPYESHDVPVDVILTPTEIVRCTGR